MRELDQRKSSRNPVEENQQECELQVGKTRTPAKLIDHSAGGFSILVDQMPGIAVRQKAALRTANGWFRVRVVHINEVGAFIATLTGKSQSRYRLGLRRLGEVDGPPDCFAAERGDGQRFWPLGRVRSSRAAVVVGAILTIIVGGFLLVSSGVIPAHSAAFLEQALHRGSSQSPPAVSAAPADANLAEPASSHRSLPPAKTTEENS
jgi:hypothetical protein